jgi:hypothetical protein
MQILPSRQLARIVRRHVSSHGIPGRASAEHLAQGWRRSHCGTLQKTQRKTFVTAWHRPASTWQAAPSGNNLPLCLSYHYEPSANLLRTHVGPTSRRLGRLFALWGLEESAQLNGPRQDLLNLVAAEYLETSFVNASSFVTVSPRASSQPFLTGSTGSCPGTTNARQITIS